MVDSVPSGIVVAVNPPQGSIRNLNKYTPHSAFQFQLASSQCPLSTGEPPEAVTPERHLVFLRPPEILASIDLDSESDTLWRAHLS